MGQILTLHLVNDLGSDSISGSQSDVPSLWPGTPVPYDFTTPPQAMRPVWIGVSANGTTNQVYPITATVPSIIGAGWPRVYQATEIVGPNGDVLVFSEQYLHVLNALAACCATGILTGVYVFLSSRYSLDPTAPVPPCGTEAIFKWLAVRSEEETRTLTYSFIAHLISADTLLTQDVGYAVDLPFTETLQLVKSWSTDFAGLEAYALGTIGVEVTIKEAGSPVLSELQTFRLPDICVDESSSGSSSSSGESSIGESSSEPEFSPLDVEGLRVWLDMTDQDTITADEDGLISQVEDKSGNDFHVVQETPGEQPLLDTSGAHPFAAFSPGQTLLNSDLTNNQPYTLYMVPRQISSLNVGKEIGLGSGATGIFQMNTGENGNFDYLSPANGTSFVLDRDSNLYSTFFELAAFKIDGAATKGAANREIYNPSKYNPGSTNITLFQVGGTAEFDLLEILLYDGIVSPADDKNIRNYLSAKYSDVIPSTNYMACFGDSITAGSVVGYNKTYVYLTHIDRDLHLYNFAMGGAAVNSGANNLVDTQIEQGYSLDPTWNSGYAVFNFGTNHADYDADAVAWKADYKASIQQMLTAGYDPAKVIILTPHYISTSGYLPGMNIIITAIASELGIVLGDLYSYTQANGGDALLSDGVHLSEAGNVVAATFLQTLIP